jgi:lycopene cyclase domain-containing protein
MSAIYLLCLLAASACVVAVDLRFRLFLGSSWRQALLALAAFALLVLTAAFDTVMIAAGLFTYADPLILGPRIGLAPIEDFAYPLAAVILLPALWMRLRSRDDR